MSVKMAIFIICCCMLLFFNKSEIIFINDEQELADVLEFKLAFGSELSDTKNDYLLVRPLDYRGNENGDFLVPDEVKIKVFDTNGKEKKIFGRRGQGPGDFESDPRPFLNSEGDVLVLTGSTSGSYYSLFTPDYGFIEKRKFINSQRLSEYINSIGFKKSNIITFFKAFPVSSTEIIYDVELGSDEEIFFSLIYENTHSLKPLIHIKDPGSVKIPGLGYSSSGMLGKIYWNILPDRRIVYINTDEDYIDEQKGSYYNIHVLNIDSLSDKQLSHRYTPVQTPERYRNSQTQTEIPIPMPLNELSRRTREMVAKRKYIPSVDHIQVDRHYLFVYLKYDYDNIDSSKHIDIFDLNNYKYVNSINYTNWPGIFQNGYVFKLKDDKNGFLEFRKYKINPTVYGLPEDPDWREKK